MESRTMTVSLGTSQYGNPKPQIEVRLPPGSSHRAVLAELHKVAAEVELATPDSETWSVHLELGWDWRAANGRVYLELDRATGAEADRGLAVLRKVAQQRTPA